MRILGNTSQGLSALATTSSAIARALGRLSSGLRVSRPQDDPASYSLGVNLDAQIRGLRTGVTGVAQAAGLASAADEGVQSQIDVVQRMRELALQASNSSVSSVEREALHKEVQELLSQFKQISASTTLNGQKLLDGSFGTRTIYAGGDSTIDFSISGTRAGQIFEKYLGSGTMLSRSTYYNQGGARQTELEDLNNDGKLDLIEIQPTTGSLSIRLGNGSGTFQALQTTPKTSNAERFALTDLNGDGIKDLVIANETTSISWAIGKGDGTFESLQTKTGFSSTVRDVTVGDFNGDGDMDIVALSGAGAATTPYLEFVEGNGDGTLGSITSQAITAVSGLASAPVRIVAAEFNHDGITDVAVDNGDLGASNLVVYRGNGTGGFVHLYTGVMLDGAGTYMGITTGDVGNDGDVDILSEDHSGGVAMGTVFSNNGYGSFTAGTQNFLYTLDARIADFDGDGLNDIISVNGFQVDVFRGIGGDNFSSSGFFSTGNLGLNSAYTVAVGDLNRDGVLDFVTSGFSGNSTYAYLQNRKEVSAEGDIDVRTQAKAEKLVAILDSTLENLKRESGKLSAIHSRLDQNAAANLILSDDLEEAKSRVLDLDYALELAEVVRLQILQESQVAVAAQANVQRQMVLALLSDL